MLTFSLLLLQRSESSSLVSPVLVKKYLTSLVSLFLFLFSESLFVPGCMGKEVIVGFCLSPMLFVSVGLYKVALFNDSLGVSLCLLDGSSVCLFVISTSITLVLPSVGFSIMSLTACAVFDVFFYVCWCSVLRLDHEFWPQ